MKKIKYVILALMTISITGCFNKSKMDNADVRVSVYPIEYITENLYGKYSKIKSIYPDDMDNDYVVNEKLLNDYSKTNLFIFNGNNDNENDYVYNMFTSNKKLKIIDSTASLNYNNKIEELWLDPMNCLTMTNNIKKGLKEYIEEAYIKNNIDENFEKLKVELIQLEADYKETANRANNKTIVVGDDLFLYLSKYGINVISLEESKNYTKKNLYDAESLIKKGTIKVIYVKKGQELSENIKYLKTKYNIDIVELNTMITLSSDDRKNGKDYLSIMYDNLELLKKQLYN